MGGLAPTGQSVGGSGLEPSVYAGVVGDSDTDDGAWNVSRGKWRPRRYQWQRPERCLRARPEFGWRVWRLHVVRKRPSTTADGVASFLRSGLVSIAAGKKSKTVSDVDLYTTGPHGLGGNPSLVLANLQNSLPGVYVEAVVPDISASSFTIYL